MGDFVYTTVPGKLKDLLSKIRTVGIPARVTQQWIKSIGFKSSNDGSLIGVLKFIGLIDQSGVPTSAWGQYRGAKHKIVLGGAIRQGYAELFAVYPDANQRSQTELDHVFSTSSSGGKQVIAKTIATFKALADEADFSDETGNELLVETATLHIPAATLPQASKGASKSTNPSLHIDIQIHISADSSAEQIDQIFQSMSKHLYGGNAA